MVRVKGKTKGQRKASYAEKMERRRKKRKSVSPTTVSPAGLLVVPEGHRVAGKAFVTKKKGEK